MRKIEEIVEILQDAVNYMERKDDEDMDATSFHYEEGIIISGNDAKAIIQFYNIKK